MAAAEQRDVYLIKPPFDPSLDAHPFIVLSIKESNECEDTFIGVMITSSTVYVDDHSFTLSDSMFRYPLDKANCHVRMQLMTLCKKRDAGNGSPINRMKPLYFKELMKSIGELVFNYDFLPLEG